MSLLDMLMDGLMNSYNGKITTEKVEFTKGNFKTIATMMFREDGMLLNISTRIEYIPTEAEVKENERQNKLKELDKELKIALKKEDYMECARIKKEQDSLNQQ